MIFCKGLQCLCVNGQYHFKALRTLPRVYLHLEVRKLFFCVWFSHIDREIITLKCYSPMMFWNLLWQDGGGRWRHVWSAAGDWWKGNIGEQSPSLTPWTKSWTSQDDPVHPSACLWSLAVMFLERKIDILMCECVKSLNYKHTSRMW